MVLYLYFKIFWIYFLVSISKIVPFFNWTLGILLFLSILPCQHPVVCPHSQNLTILEFCFLWCCVTKETTCHGNTNNAMDFVTLKILQNDLGCFNQYWWSIHIIHWSFVILHLDSWMALVHTNQWKTQEAYESQMKNVF